MDKTKTSYATKTCTIKSWVSIILGGCWSVKLTRIPEAWNGSIITNIDCELDVSKLAERVSGKPSFDRRMPSYQGCRRGESSFAGIKNREENLGCEMKNVLSIVAMVAIASITGMFHVFLLSFVKLTGPTLLYREVILDYHDTQSQIWLDRLQQLLRTIFYWQGSRAPWKSLNFKIKIQVLENCSRSWKILDFRFDFIQPSKHR